MVAAGVETPRGFLGPLAGPAWRRVIVAAALNANVIGVDVGGTKILAGVVGRDGTVARHREHATPLESEQALLDGLEAAVDDLRNESVVAVGFGVPSRIDQRAGIAIGSVNIPRIDVRLRNVMSPRLGLPAPK